MCYLGCGWENLLPRVNGGAAVEDEIRLALTHDEALVLFEFLCRFSDRGVLSIEDHAEQVALWNLQCVMETKIDEVFRPDFGELVQQARDRLRGQVE